MSRKYEKDLRNEQNIDQPLKILPMILMQLTDTRGLLGHEENRRTILDIITKTARIKAGILKRGKILDMKTSRRLGRLHGNPEQRSPKLVNVDERN